MASRLELHDELIKILGIKNVYYQPPASIRMKYPAVVYKLDSIDATHADDSKYLESRRYQVTVIDEDPDSELFEKMVRFPKAILGRPPYISDNLNHWVFYLYY